MTSNKRVMITGASGFIGSNLARRFVNMGWDVVGVDNLSTGRREFLPAIKTFIQDDFASERVLEIVRSTSFDVVCHLAARPRVSYSVDFPIESNDVNVTKTLALLDACRGGNVGRFVNTSSSSVYGGAARLPTHENECKCPKSPYALQKLITEQYCELFSELYGLQTVSVRPFNVFGPNCLGDNPYATAVSAWLYAAKHGKPLRSDGNGTQTRDVTYVTNVVDVFVGAATSERVMMGDAYNAGTGSSVSNNDVLEWFKKRFPEAEVQQAPWRPGDVMHTLADVSRAANDFGYAPKVDVWKGLELTAAWAMNSDIF